MTKRLSKPLKYSILELNDRNQDDLILMAFDYYREECKKLSIKPKSPDTSLIEVTSNYIRFFDKAGLIATVYCSITSSTFRKNLQMKVEFPETNNSLNPE